MGRGKLPVFQGIKLSISPGDHSTVEEMGLTNKSEGELQLTSNNSDTSNSDTPREEQGKEIQQPEQACSGFLIPA